MRLLILLALAAAVSAEVGWVHPVCPEPNEFLFHTSREAICLHLHKEPKLFEDAVKYCLKRKSRLATLHLRTKLVFLNNIIVNKLGAKNFPTTWFTEPIERDHKLRGLARMVFIPNRNPEMLKTERNDTNAERSFVCELPARPTTHRPQFYRQPEDVQLSHDIFEEVKEEHKDKKIEKIETIEKVGKKVEKIEIKKPKESFREKMEHLRQKKTPFTISFHCRAFALPKPKLEWIWMAENAENNTLVQEPMDAKVIHNLYEGMREVRKNPTKTFIFDKHRDCRRRHCNPDGIMQTSELIIVNPQNLNVLRRVVCVASNTAGSVISREAQIIVNKMEKFPTEEQEFKVQRGKSIVIPCKLDTVPDASAEWLRVRPNGILEKIERTNRISRGNTQTSKATFDLIIDAAMAQDAGKYICRVQMHNGRYHFVHRDLKVNLIVEDCKEDCDLEKKPIEVVPNYPQFLSLNPMDNKVIRYGDAVLLECPCFGKRDPRELLQVNWNITSNGIRRLGVLPMGSAMLIERATESFSGYYACRCVRRSRKGPEEEKSAWSSVGIEVLPRFAPEKIPLSMAKVNGTAQVTCELPKLQIQGVEVIVTPMRGRHSLFDLLEKKNDKRFRLTDKDEKYTIHIKKVQPEDAGIYGCRVSVNYFDKWTEHDTYYTSLIVKQ